MIQTERLTLFFPDTGWAPELAAFFRENRTHLEPWGPPMFPEMFDAAYWEAQIVAQIATRAQRPEARFLVARRGERRVLGTVSLFDVHGAGQERAMIAYSLASWAEGHGYMTEAARAAVDYGFGEMRLHRIWTTYDVDNVRSGRVLARLGFEREGIMRGYMCRGGQWRDHVLVARLRPGSDAA